MCQWGKNGQNDESLTFEMKSQNILFSNKKVIFKIKIIY